MSYDINTLTLPNGISIFYRSAGPKDGPILLLLHGFPDSSHQYRHLIPLLSQKYHVIAPDYPGFGFTTVPSSLSYIYTFANLATTILSFLDVLSITKFSIFIFDYGAPIGFRIALQRPHAIQAVVSQNGNCYSEGLGGAHWGLRREWWATRSPSLREAVRAKTLNLEATKAQYTAGTDRVIEPESYTLAWALMKSPRKQDVMLDLLGDYGANVDLYPRFQGWLRESGVKVLAVWGKNDKSFVPEGAWAFRKDVPDAEVVLVDAGHFAVESHGREIVGYMLDWLGRVGL